MFKADGPRTPAHDEHCQYCFAESTTEDGRMILLHHINGRISELEVI